MIFLPKGVKNGEVIDPENISSDFIGASQTLGQTNHYQWAEDTMTQRVNLESGTHVSVINKQVIGQLQITNTVDPVVGRTGGSPSGGLWTVPMDRGFQSVTGVQADWVSPYPELVMICYSMQYYVGDQAVVNAMLGGSNSRIRFQSLIQLDGANIVGTGPYATENSVSFTRGVGFAHTSLGVSATTVQMVSAGVHSATIVAGQARPDPVLDTLSFFDYDYKADSGNLDFAGIVIGNRNLIVIRFGRGGWLGG